MIFKIEDTKTKHVKAIAYDSKTAEMIRSVLEDSVMEDSDPPRFITKKEKHVKHSKKG